MDLLFDVKKSIQMRIADSKGKHLASPKKVPTIGLIIFKRTTDIRPYIKKKLISMYLNPSATFSSVSAAPMFPNDAVIAEGNIFVKPNKPFVIIW